MIPDLKIRAETAEDIGEVRNLTIAAFDGDAEARLVDRLREAACVVSLVAEVRGEIVGHLMLSTLEAPFPALSLAPVSVAPVWQAQGIGGALIREAIRLARADAIFVLGEPEYYTRFGFDVEAAVGYVSPWSGPYFMVLPLIKDLPPTGRIIYPEAFSAL